MTQYVGYDDALHGDDGLDGDDLDGEEYMAADDAEILGALLRRKKRGGRQVARKPQLQASSAPPTRLRGYLGMGTAVFTDASGTLLQVQVEPQRSFRPERLIVDRTDATAGTADVAARVNAIFIGDQPQSPSVEQPAPISMFRPDATVSGIDFNKCVPGQKIVIQFSISRALVPGEVVTVSSGFYGDMLR